MTPKWLSTRKLLQSGLLPAAASRCRVLQVDGVAYRGMLQQLECPLRLEFSPVEFLPEAGRREPFSRVIPDHDVFQSLASAKRLQVVLGEVLGSEIELRQAHCR